MRIPYAWRTGRGYRLAIESVGRDTDGRWWAATVRDTVTGAERHVGAIQAPRAWGGLASRFIDWIEFYSGPQPDCDAFNYASARFTDHSAEQGDVGVIGRRDWVGGGRPLLRPLGPQEIPGGVRQWMGV